MATRPPRESIAATRRSAPNSAFRTAAKSESTAPSRTSEEPRIARFAPASNTLLRIGRAADAAAHLARQLAAETRDQRAVIALTHGGVEVDQLHQRVLREPRLPTRRNCRTREPFSRLAQVGRCGRPSHQWRESACQPHGDASVPQFTLNRLHRLQAEVKHRRS